MSLKTKNNEINRFYNSYFIRCFHKIFLRTVYCFFFLQSVWIFMVVNITDSM